MTIPNTIPLYGGLVAKIDPEDYPVLRMYRWHRSCKGYAGCSPSPGRTVFMHRFLIDAPEGMQVDHINGDKLDNRKANLRLCTNAENCRTLRKKNPIGFRGVRKAGEGKYDASISFNYKTTHLGRFKTVEEAAAAYKGAAKVLFGKFQPIDFRHDASAFGEA